MEMQMVKLFLGSTDSDSGMRKRQSKRFSLGLCFYLTVFIAF